MLHGISWIIVGVDGILIKRIPLRIKQFIFLETFSILYLVWSILHSALNVGNPWNNNEGENQPIYDTVDWENGTGFAIGLAVVLLFAGLPIIFMLCRALSLSLPMRCRNNDVCEAFNDEESLEIYPNPARDAFQLLAPEAGYVMVTGIDGKTILEGNHAGNWQTISTAHWSAGMYKVIWVGEQEQSSATLLIAD